MAGGRSGGARHDEPTPDEWRTLYATAVAFRDRAPWEWMEEEEVFGVQDPESGVVGYCTITGNLGEHFALIVYRGTAGLDGLWRMRLGPPPGPMTSLVEVLVLQDCLMASFEDRELMQPADLERFKHLGLKFRGRNAWPQLRSYLPGYEPWHLTGSESRFLTCALQQALEVAERYQEDTLPAPGPFGPYLVRVPAPGSDGRVWHDALRRPEALPNEPVPKELQVDPARLARLRESLPGTDGIIEVDLFTAPTVIREAKDQRPFLPTLLLMVDAGSEHLLGVGTFPSGGPVPAAAAFVDSLERVGMLPAQARVAQEAVYAALEQPARELGIELRWVNELPAVEDARGSLFEHLGF